MSEPKLNSPKPENTDKAYRRILQRLADSVAVAEDKTWSAIQYDIDQAIELEAAAEEMTRDELNLLAAYLKRDLQSLTHFTSETRQGLAQWLKFDLHLLEDRLLVLLGSVFDKTVIARAEREQWLNRHPQEYQAGEYVIAGTFSCQDCGESVSVITPGILPPCTHCGATQYSRVTLADQA